MTIDELRNRIGADPEVRAQRDRLATLEERRKAAEAKLAGLLEGRGDTRSRNDLVRDLAEGREVDLTPGPAPDIVQEAHRDAALLRDAVVVAKQLLHTAEAKAGAAIAKTLRPEFRERWERVAVAAAAFSEATAALECEYDALRSAGILFSGSLPVAAPLAWADARDPDSRLNQFVSEIESAWGLSIPRRVRDDAVKLAKRNRLETDKRRALADEKHRQEEEARKKAARERQARKHTRRALPIEA